MKVIDVTKMFTKDYLDQLKVEGKEFYGQPYCLEINGKLYMKYIMAKGVGYHICDNWIEEV